MLGDVDEQAREELAALTRTIVSSLALLARERQIFDGYTLSLAEVIPGEGIEPWVTANALMGVHRALVGFARERILAGVRHPALGDEVRAEADRALALLDRGL
jgi:hypothetical protein